jgi:ribosomal protein S2
MIKALKLSTKKQTRPKSMGSAKLMTGNILTVKITALGTNNIGINEFGFGMPILVNLANRSGTGEPNAKLGDTVQVQINKIVTKGNSNIAIAKLMPSSTREGAPFKVLSTIKVTENGTSNTKTGKTKTQSSEKVNNLKSEKTMSHEAVTLGAELPTKSLGLLKPGDSLEGTINKLGPNSTGVVELENSPYQNVTKIFVKLSQPSSPEGGFQGGVALNTKVNITITRIKTNYAFGIITNSPESGLEDVTLDTTKNGTNKLKTSGKLEGKLNGWHNNLVGLKFSLRIPTKGSLRNAREGAALTGKSSVGGSNGVKSGKNKALKTDIKRLNNTATINFKSSSIFTRKLRGMATLKYMVFKLSTKTKLPVKWGANSLNGLNGNALLNNVLPPKTLLVVKPNLGAKAGDKVQIQITKFISANGALKSNVVLAKIIKLNPMSGKQKKTLVQTSLRQMLKSGMHYGEKAIKCNARMKNYVWIRKKGQNLNKPLIKKGRNIINLLKTRRCLNKALTQLAKYAVKGKTFLFVGTKKAASGLVSRASLFSKKAFFVNTRWLGGMLTNWKTILKSISLIRPILKEKQIIIKDILEKRKNIKSRLLQKALLLRKKSKVMLKKGFKLIQMLRSNGSNLQGQINSSGDAHLNMGIFVEKTKQLNLKRKEFISKGIVLLEKRQQLLLKRQELISQSQTLKTKATELTTTYRQLLTNLIVSRKKLRELKSLLIISKELQAFKLNSLQQNQSLYMLKLKPNVKGVQALKSNTVTSQGVLSNPPKEILSKMVAICRAAKNTANIILPSNSGDLNLKSELPNLTKIKMLSQLLSKFSVFVPTIKTSIQNLQTYTANIQNSLTVVKNLLTAVKTKMLTYLELKNQIILELRQIKSTLYIERNIIRVLKRKLKQIQSQKRLMDFLPKLRYLPTPTHKLEQTARFLMKKFVDPKMKYPMDSIYDEKLSGQSKKVAASRKKKWQRLEKYLGGISNMTKLKEKHIRNNIAIIIGQQEEMNAVRECQKLGIKMFHIVDTNCNPGFADHFIPANDDARNSIKFILGQFLTRIRLAQKLKLKSRFAKKSFLSNSR